MICMIGGGTGGARLARGLSEFSPSEPLISICNVGDNIRLYGLTICPDIDTVIYYLSGTADESRGWGLRAESFNFLERSRLFYPDTWFGLGDKDLATHLWRSELLRAGRSLTEITAQEALLCGVQARILPATDGWVETRVETTDLPAATSGTTFHYEEYFVRLRCEPCIHRVYYAGIERAEPAPGVLESIASARLVLIAPSNPLASILPIVSIPGVREALVKNREKVWAISPIIAGLALPEGEKTRARSRQRLLASLGLAHTPASVGLLYREFCTHFVLDERDFRYASQLEEMQYEVHLLKTDALSLERQVELAGDLVRLSNANNAASF